MTMLAISWGPMEIGMILLVLLLMFGSSKLPKLARGLGASVTEFKKGLRDGSDKDKLSGGDDGDESEPES